jgi:hypothetical protein
MKKALFTILLIATAMHTAWSQENPKTPGNLVVEARLTEVLGTLPPNDLYNYVYIFKYKVIRVIEGKLEASEILVGHYNPLKARKDITDKMDAHVDGDVDKIQAGAKHILTLTTPISSVWNEAIEDEYFDEDSIRYFALVTNKAP